MKAFIKKHEFNYIRKWLSDLNNAFKSCADPKIIAANKGYIQDKILKLFADLSEEEKALLDIDSVAGSADMDAYLSKLNDHTYGMKSVTDTQLSKLFKKEKKLKLPKQPSDSKIIYLGWTDRAVNKLYVVYPLQGSLVGMACRITEPASNNKHRCMFCGRVGSEEEIAFVTALCKTPHAAEGTYRSVGFDICLDHERCNERMVSVERLEQILKDVNNIKG